ncbi:hypothetical protein CFC21_066369 [Triticum aestivum]|uniref:Uncharacterized protein n=2 Tax=Triticum aestivum TaxID=4565 RepID=A0A9R1KMF8_WHEAT|nr:hypothetical protein CFC21_066369 [Triticum aestivum]
MEVIGTFLATTSDFVVTWWLFSTIKDLCRTELLPRGSPWTCPSTRMIYNEMVVWGLIGPRQMFFKGVYSKLVYFFLIGIIAPIPFWILARRFPEKKWIKLIRVPVLFMLGAQMPPARAVNYICWFVLGFIFNYIIFRRCKELWARYSLLFSVAMDTGIAAMALLTMLVLQMRGINGINGWGSSVSDHCPLATCPTEPGVYVEGCPLVH